MARGFQRGPAQPHYGSLSVYFNRGILATQATAHVLTDGSPAGSIVDELKRT